MDNFKCCNNCSHQIEPLCSCEWLESQTQIIMPPCPRWESKERIEVSARCATCEDSHLCDVCDIPIIVNAITGRGNIMNEYMYEYKVIVEDKTIGTFSTLGDALLYIKACDYEYFNDPNWKYTIERIDVRVHDNSNYREGL